MRIESSRVLDNGQVGIAGDGSTVAMTTLGLRGPGRRDGHRGGGQRRPRPVPVRGARGCEDQERGRGLVLRGQLGPRNQGCRVWWDIDDVDSEIRGNLVEHNDLGIEYEISFGRAVISDNVILDNGLDHDWGLPYGSGVFVSNSSGVEVRGNVIDGAAYGIVVYGQDRGSSDRLGRVWELRDVTVAGNVIAATEVAEWLYARPGPAPGIVFEDNAFVVDGSAPPVLRDGLEDLDLSRWRPWDTTWARSW